MNSAGDNFPNGVIYSFDGVNNRIIISGTPTSPGTHTFSLKYYNNQTIESSTVSVVVIGQLIVLANTTTSTSTTGNIYFENGTCKCPNATVGETADINGVTYTVVDDSTIKDQICEW